MHKSPAGQKLRTLFNMISEKTSKDYTSESSIIQPLLIFYFVGIFLYLFYTTQQSSINSNSDRVRDPRFMILYRNRANEIKNTIHRQLIYISFTKSDYENIPLQSFYSLIPYVIPRYCSRLYVHFEYLLRQPRNNNTFKKDEL